MFKENASKGKGGIHKACTGQVPGRKKSLNREGREDRSKVTKNKLGRASHPIVPEKLNAFVGYNPATLWGVPVGEVYLCDVLRSAGM